MGARFSARPDRPWGPPSLLYNGYRVFPGGKVRPRRDADPSPTSSVVVKKEYSYTSIPLWAVRPVRSFSACTELQCLYGTSVPLRSFSTKLLCLYGASVSIRSFSAYTELQGLYGVSVRSFSACTELQYRYGASVPVLSFSACTKLRCLYKGALYLFLAYCPYKVNERAVPASMITRLKHERS